MYHPSNNMDDDGTAPSTNTAPTILRLPREVRDNILDIVAKDDKRSLFLSIRLRGKNTKPDIHAYTTNPIGHTCSQLRREYTEAVIRRFKGLGELENGLLSNADESKELHFRVKSAQCLRSSFSQYSQSLTLSTTLCPGAVSADVLWGAWCNSWAYNLKVEFVADERMELDRRSVKFFPHDKSTELAHFLGASVALHSLVKSTNWKGSEGCLALWNAYDFMQCSTLPGVSAVIKVADKRLA